MRPQHAAPAACHAACLVEVTLGQSCRQNRSVELGRKEPLLSGMPDRLTAHRTSAFRVQRPAGTPEIRTGIMETTPEGVKLLKGHMITKNAIAG